MPAAAAAAVASWAASTAAVGVTVSSFSAALAYGGFMAAAAYAATYAAVTIGLSMATSALVGAISKKPKSGGGDSSAGASMNDTTRTMTVRQPVAPRRIIYGQVRVGGVYSFMHLTGSNNKFLNMVITLSGHQIEAIDKMYFDGVEVELQGASYQTWEAKSYSTGAQVYSGGLYYQRTATPYPTSLDLTVMPSLSPQWDLVQTVYSSPPWVSGTNYPVNSVVINPTGNTCYKRNATDYPLVADVSAPPASAGSLWSAIAAPTTLSYDGAGKYKASSSGEAYVHVEYNLGGDDQAAFAGLMGEAPGKWTASHRQRGCASVYLRLTYSVDLFSGGIPAITFLVRGKNNIYDPRTGTRGYSTNSALCAADYLSDPRYGIGAQYGSEIIEPDLIEAANICDELVTLKAGGTEKRYTTNGSFNCDATPYDAILGLTSAMAGCVITQGLYWYFRAGAWRTPEAFTITESDIVGGMTINTLSSRSDIFNTVHGTFINPSNEWQQTDFPEVSVPAYVTADKGEVIVRDVELPWTITQTMAQRISRIMLEEQRRQISITFPVKTSAYQLQPWDNVAVTLARYGWDEKIFRVKDSTLNLGDDGTISVSLSLKEIDANAYAWDSENDEGETVPVATTTLPSAFTPASIGSITLTENVVELAAGGVSTNLGVVLTTTDSPYVSSYEVGYKKSTDTAYIFGGSSSGLQYTINGVEDGVTYDVRARTVSHVGVRGEWLNTSIYVLGQLAPPPDVTGFKMNVVGDVAYLSWNSVSVVDLSHYRIRYTNLITGANVSNSFVLVDKVAKPSTSISVQAMVGTYLITAVDFGGRESVNAALIVSEVTGLSVVNAVITSTQDPGWLGVRDKVTVDDGSLILDYDSDLFSVADIFEWPDIFMLDKGFAALGTYYFDNYIDLSEVYTSRISAQITISSLNVNADIFVLADMFAMPDIFFENPTSWGATLFVSTTDDDPAGSPVIWSAWQEFVVGDYSARALRFKMVLESSEYSVTPVIEALSVTIDMPDRILSGKDLVVPVGGLTTTFTPAFKELKSLTLIGQGLATGDYYDISGKSSSGFNIIFRNAAGAAVQRTMDYTAIGYGRVTP